MYYTKIMKYSEFNNVLIAIIILTAVGSFGFALNSDWNLVAKTFVFSAIIILVAVFSRKLIAYMLDSGVEHEVWSVYRYFWKPGWHFNKPVPAGIILPLFFSLFSLGTLKVATILTYETRALKYRAARRFGSYSFTEMTDWHNGIIGAAGILGVLILALISYFIPFTNLEYLTKLAIFYAFWNMVPVSNSDGTQIFFGSRILWTVLAVITGIFTVYALLL